LSGYVRKRFSIEFFRFEREGGRMFVTEKLTDSKKTGEGV
jgi:hypothetical protein